jgi:hypothetical protein
MVFGIVFLLVGVLGLVTSGGLSMAAEPAPGMIFAIFPVNLVHNVVHILFGVWGVLAARSFAGAKTYCTVGGIIYIVLAICGYFIPSTFGLIPIGGNNIWLHALLGIVLAVVGFTAKDSMPAAPAAA